MEKNLSHLKMFLYRGYKKKLSVLKLLRQDSWHTQNKFRKSWMEARRIQQVRRLQSHKAVLQSESWVCWGLSCSDALNYSLWELPEPSPAGRARSVPWWCWGGRRRASPPSRRSPGPMFWWKSRTPFLRAAGRSAQRGGWPSSCTPSTCRAPPPRMGRHTDLAPRLQDHVENQNLITTSCETVCCAEIISPLT